MRRPFIALMVALLLFRGWVGEVMAMEMSVTVQQHFAIQNIANNQAYTGEIASFDSQIDSQIDVQPASHGMSGHVNQATVDCQGHGATGVTIESGQSDGFSNDLRAHHGCNLCQICHGAAMTPSAWVPMDTHPMPLAAPRHAEAFASTLLAPGFKPPIS